MGSIEEFIYKRELGQSSSSDYLEQALVWNNLFLTSFYPEGSRIGVEKIGSESIWIRSRDNFIVSIDKKGKAILGTILPSSSWIILSKRNEIAYKAFFTSECLIVVLKRAQDSLLRFYSHAYINLVQGSDCRREIMQNSSINISHLDQFDIENFFVVLKKNKIVSIWNILTEALQFQMEVPNDYEAQYSNSSILCWKANQNGLDLRIKIFNAITEHHFFVRNINKVNFISRIKNSIFIAGLNKIIFIDLRNGSVFEIQIYSISQIYAPDSNDGIILNTGETMIFLTDYGTVLSFKEKYPLISDTKELVVAFSSETSKIFVISKSPVKILACVDIPRSIKVSAIGINESTNQIFIGTNFGELLLLD
ncbi:unnamed protein product [Blepharisma stoltei]|uniref:Uncharacterized protein n=1 Tax=Blepharisma stoltei TaxID=1481888 RepID=A0AAU9K235_9CILI|nr:unnamed protein product [Blepharisma stoltei]